MALVIQSLALADLIALGHQVIGGDDHFAGQPWQLPAALRTTLSTELSTLETLYLKQNFSQGEKERLVKQKKDAIENDLIPNIRRVVHFIKAMADDPENVLNSYGYDPGDFPTAEADIVGLGESIIHGNAEHAGEPYELPIDLRDNLKDAVSEVETLMGAVSIAMGESQETTQTQNESKSRLEHILSRCR